MTHHTKDKADIAVSKTISDTIYKNLLVVIGHKSDKSDKSTLIVESETQWAGRLSRT